MKGARDMVYIQADYRNVRQSCIVNTSSTAKQRLHFSQVHD